MNNTSVLARLDEIWRENPERPMLVCDSSGLAYRDFRRQLNLVIEQLKRLAPKAVALLGDNSSDWLLVDFACQLLDIPLLPLPGYFSPEQMQHSIVEAGCDVLLMENTLLSRLPEQALAAEVVASLCRYLVMRLPACAAGRLPPGTAKVTFTSGSTGNPKGVCLSAAHQWRVAESIEKAVKMPIAQHMCLLPLATLLENVAGVYASLLNGTSVLLPGLASLGFSGSSSLDFNRLIDKISQLQPGSLITTPELLGGLVLAAEQGWCVPQSLSFVAVGGARVAPALLRRAKCCGIPAYQGYGLSECASVVSLNVPQDSHGSTMGKVLPHAGVAIENGEIVVEGSTFLGYAGQPDSWGQNKVFTGDLGRLDEQGQLVVTGRRKNLLISSYGRNINPEWVESELLASTLIRQAFVFGDDKPYCVAALGVSSLQVTAQQVAHWVSQVNAALPDYARVRKWFLLTQPVTPHSGLLTNNGRPKRAPLQRFFEEQIESLYDQQLVPVGQE